MKSYRTAIVTGGTAGIGFEIARDLLSRGYGVYICGRRQVQLDNALVSLDKEFSDGKVFGSVCDVSSLNSVNEMVELAGRRLGIIDTLINNAGISFIESFEEITPDMWAEIIGTNLTGVYNCCKAALPWLKKAQGADIVNIGSRSGRYAFAGGAGYNTTKFGLQGFTEALFLDLHKFSIRVSLVAPGIVSTGLAGKNPEPWHLEPSDVAKVVGDLIGTESRAAINWVEIRPARPR